MSTDLDRSSLRASVTAKADKVWDLRDGRDLYTRRTRRETLKPEVDHVIEIQLHEAIFKRALASAGVAAQTRGAHAGYRTLVNHVSYLNVTSKPINKAKEGPFRRFKHMYLENAERSRSLRNRSLDDCARASASSHQQIRKMIDEGVWAKITAAVVRTWYQMEDNVGEYVANAAMSEHLVDEMQAMLAAMDISSK